MKGEVKAKLVDPALLLKTLGKGDVFQTKRKFEKPKNAASSVTA